MPDDSATWLSTGARSTRPRATPRRAPRRYEPYGRPLRGELGLPPFERFRDLARPYLGRPPG